MINAADYGRALFELAREEGSDETCLEEMNQVNRVLQDNPEYAKLLDSPALSARERTELVGTAFAGLGLYHLNFLKILCEKHAVRQYAHCVKAYRKLYDEAHGVLRATALTAVPMTKDQLDSLTAKLSGLTGKQAIVENRVDPAVLGGVQLRYERCQLDGSIQTRLDDLRRILRGAIV